VRQGRAVAPLGARASNGGAITAGMTSDFPAPGFCYEERALLPRHSFAEMKRMHGQKPL